MERGSRTGGEDEGRGEKGLHWGAGLVPGKLTVISKSPIP
jgi:hypothetical protein